MKLEAWEQEAKDFCIEKHEAIQQKRKYTYEPYWTHPEAVVAILKKIPHTKEMIIAAWLHDTVEDAGVSLDEIEQRFGSLVASYVEQLTDISKPEDGNREQRKKIDREHTAKAEPDVKTIKLADLIHNSFSILNHDLKFSKTYLPEKVLLLEVLTEGDNTLWYQAATICKDAGYINDEGITKTIQNHSINFDFG